MCSEDGNKHQHGQTSNDKTSVDSRILPINKLIHSKKIFNTFQPMCPDPADNKKKLLRNPFETYLSKVSRRKNM